MISSVVKFMSQKTDSQQIKLPEGKMISLCQAVTAFAVGKASDSFHYDLFGEAETEEERAKIKNLIQQLHSAAYAGRIRFRALRNGDSPADGHKDIDPLYFSERRGLRWNCDEIWVSGLSPRRPTFESQGRFTVDWRDVHLDREDFEALLRDMGVSVVQSLDAVAPGKRKTLTTGMPGRPTSKHLVLEIARRRFDAGNLPSNLAAFSRELADALRNEEPQAAPMKAKTVCNAVREPWRAHQKLPKPAGSS
jgi:hypothetical protein